jgi:hypothetical protein
VPVVHIYRDHKDCSSKPDSANSSQDPISKNVHKKGLWKGSNPSIAKKKEKKKDDVGVLNMGKLLGPH